MTKEIKPLTGLRGIAAIFVLFYHFFENDAYLHDQMPWLVRHGYLGVDVFFVLSGFLMALTYAQFFKNRLTMANYTIYLIKRIARIYPLYIVMTFFFLIQYLLSYYAGGSHIEGGYQINDFLAGLLMIQGWGLGFTTVEAANWAVSTEFFAYLLFPLLLFVAVYARPVFAAIAAIVFAFILYVIAATHSGGHGDLDVSLKVLPLLRCLAGFGLGLVSYRASQFDICRKVFSSSVTLIVLVGGMVGAAYFEPNDLIVYLFFPFLVMALFFNGPAARMLFANRFVHHLGMVSYGIYLVHPFFVGVKTHLDMLHPSDVARLITLTLVLLLTWGAAYVLHRSVELPGRRALQNKFLPRTTSRAG